MRGFAQVLAGTLAGNNGKCGACYANEIGSLMKLAVNEACFVARDSLSLTPSLSPSPSLYLYLTPNAF